MPGAKVIVELPGRPECPVRIGAHLLPAVGEAAASRFAELPRAVLISDEASGSLFRPAVKTALSQAGFRVLDITVPAGRAACALDCISEIWSAFAQNGISAQTLLVVLGDEAVCNAGAYAAAGYRGGMPLILVPTSLAAMASVSTMPRATADLDGAPRAVGAIPQPAYVCASLDTLDAQGGAAWQTGLAELVHAALMGSGDELFQLEDIADAIVARQEDVLVRGIVLSTIARADALAAMPIEPPCPSKAFGFTFGDSLMRALGAGAVAADYSSPGRLLADGMRFEARLGAAVGITPLDLVSALDALLTRFGLDPVAGLPAPDDLLDSLVDALGQRNGFLSFGVPADAGSFRMVDIDSVLVREHLRARSASLAAGDA